MRARRARWLIVPAIPLIAAAGFLIRGREGRSSATPTASTAVVTRGPLTVKVLETGRVEPALRAEIRARVGGEVVAVRVTEGQNVQRGDVLLRLDPTDYRRDVQRIQADVEEKQATLRLALRRQRQTQRGLKFGVVPGGEMDTINTDLALARAHLKAALVAKRTAEDRVRYTTVVAPFDGRVIACNVHPGEAVVPGMTATVEGRPLLVLADISQLSVRAELNQIDFARVRVGQPARITFDSVAGKVFAGEVTSLAASSVKGPNGSEILPIQIRVLPAEGLAEVMPGMSADVEIVVAEKRGTLLLPIEAVISDNGAKSVLAWSSITRRFDLRPVQTGEYSEHQIQILGGVSEGTLVQIGASGAGRDK